MDIFIGPRFTEYYKRSPITLVDVGASGGLEQTWKPAKEHLKIIGFEPDEREFANLEKKGDGNIKYLNTGLYSEKGVVDFHLARKQQTSSILKPNRKLIDKFPEAERFDITRTVKINTDTLDNQFRMNGISDIDFVKIDTQGTELFILQGAERAVAEHALGLEIEVEFVELYEGQPFFADVDSFVRKLGFQLFDIQGAYWKRAAGKLYHKKRGQLVFGNVLYLRKAEDIKKIVDNIPDSFAKKSKALKAVSICALYGYLDYAGEVFDAMGAIFDADEKAAVGSFLEKSVRFGNRIPAFKGKGMIAGLIYSLWDIIRPTHDGWASFDRKLGNR